MVWKTANRTAMAGHAAPVTAEQVAARERWQARWNLPIILAALVPLFVTSPNLRWVQIVVGLGSWIVFLVDLACNGASTPTICGAATEGSTLPSFS